LKRDASSATEGLDVVDREFLVGTFANALGKLVGDDGRMRDRLVERAAVLEATRTSARGGYVAVRLDDVTELCEAVGWAIARAWAL